MSTLKNKNMGVVKKWGVVKKIITALRRAFRRIQSLSGSPWGHSRSAADQS
jgi:hypothetical protein